MIYRAFVCACAMWLVFHPVGVAASSFASHAYSSEMSVMYFKPQHTKKHRKPPTQLVGTTRLTQVIYDPKDPKYRDYIADNHLPVPVRVDTYVVQ